MGLVKSYMQWHSSLAILFMLYVYSEAYDPMDPNGNITIKWDFMTIEDSITWVKVGIYNNQLYRHIEPPGWRLSWTWTNDRDVILSMQGAEATEQGNCSRFKPQIPHSCENTPVIVDLPPGTPYNMQSPNCCRDGVLTSLVQDASKYYASFGMYVGWNVDDAKHPIKKPTNFSIGVSGYTCSEIEDIPPTRFKTGRKRTTQALFTWQVTCSYSQFRESGKPSCCVSLSTFYSAEIISCPRCSCGCQPSSTNSKCLRFGEKSDVLELSNNEDNSSNNTLVRCTQHMCPIRVHWHIKLNYKGYWRVKLSVTNFNVYNNYTDWNLVVQHPNLQDILEVYSFKYQPLLQYGDINDTGMFWGINTYNNMLLQDGNVQTEMVLKKNPKEFTFSSGWGFPRRISFNGHDCVLPSPDSYPPLPNSSPKTRVLAPMFFILQFCFVFVSLCMIV